MKTEHRLPTEDELSNAICRAVRGTIADLLNQRHGERFYYFSLITSGEAHAPSFCAWSKEALARVASKEANPSLAERELKWSYADSPYFAFGDERFAEVRQLFEALPPVSAASNTVWSEGVDMRLRVMERAMKCLEQKGFFGSGEERNAVVVNVEVMPPDASNKFRAMRLNPPEALKAWLAEAAED